MEIKKVEIGDQFIDSKHRKSKRVSTVIDFLETRSMTTGEVIKREVLAQHEFMGQKLTSKVPFVSVQRNRIETNEE